MEMPFEYASGEILSGVKLSGNTVEVRPLLPTVTPESTLHLAML
jgi:hypothetical protein